MKFTKTKTALEWVMERQSVTTAKNSGMQNAASLSPAWKAEVTRRASELDDGSVKPMSMDEFRNFVEARIA